MSTRFNEKKCAIPAYWCGKNKVPKDVKNDKKYIARGSPSQCMKQGVGAGINIEKSKNLPSSSLQNIKYIGEIHEKNFNSAGIKTLSGLTKFFRNKNANFIKISLRGILTKKDNTPDYKAYNSTLLYLYRHGFSNLPECKEL